jgi:hypothetical protein
MYSKLASSRYGLRDEFNPSVMTPVIMRFPKCTRPYWFGKAFNLDPFYMRNPPRQRCPSPILSQHLAALALDLATHLVGPLPLHLAADVFDFFQGASDFHNTMP